MKVSILVSSLAALASGFAIERRDGTCAQQPAGTGPTVSPDTALAFSSFSNFTAASTNASTPTNYTRIFSNLSNSTSTTRYMGSTLLMNYDTAQCGSFCSQTNGCAGFNLFFERDPNQDPNVQSCPNPGSVTNIKCVLWGTPLTVATATNAGENRNGFQVVVAGSNGYNLIGFSTTPSRNPNA